MKHPLFKNARQVFVYFFIWFSLVAIQSFLLTKYYGLPLIQVVEFSLIYYGLYAFLGLVIWYPVRFIYQNENNFLSKIVNIAGVGVGTILLVIITSRSLFDVLFPLNADGLLLDKQTIPPMVVLSTLLFLILFLGYYLFLYFTSLKDKELAQEKLKTQVQESELNLLKYKLNPHFLFNSLNSINSLTLSHPAKAQEMIVKLSEYLRYSLESGKEKFKELKTELNNIRLYFQIEKIRFDERVYFSERISQKCLSKKVPGMILQPLVENAMKHGVQESAEKIKIELHCTEKKDFLEITLRNEYDPEQVPVEGTGTGLSNVKKRMENLYGRNDLVIILKKDAIFEVKLKIPLAHD